MPRPSVICQVVVLAVVQSLYHTSMIAYFLGKSIPNTADPANKYSTLKVSKLGSCVVLYSLTIRYTMYEDDAMNMILKQKFHNDVLNVGIRSIEASIPHSISSCYAFHTYLGILLRILSSIASES